MSKKIWIEPYLLAEQLKDYRRRNNMTLEELGVKLGLKPNTIWRWEHQRVNISSACYRILKIENILL